jgi:L-cysteine/cystine lyase
VVAPSSPDADRLAAARTALPALGAGIYLNTGSVGPLPVETAAAMRDYAEWELSTGRGHVDDWVEFLQRIEEARASVAALLTTDPRAIALTHSTTDAVNAFSAAIDWTPGDRAVIGSAEHAAVHAAMFVLRARGVEIDIVDIGDGGDDPATLAAVERAMTPRTRLVVMSHVAWTTGAVLPIAALAELVHAHGALLLVDGAQAAGAIPVEFETMGVDAYAVASQKWLLGPEGMGALAVRPEVADRMVPRFGGYLSFASIDQRAEGVLHAGARRFQWTAFHRPSVVGMARSISWLSMFVGLEWIHARGRASARAAADRLTAIPGVTVLTPVHQMATLVTFRIAGWTAPAALAELGSRIFAIARTVEPLDAIRISVGFFTSEDEIERFATAVALIASHTPETIPPRRTLTILGEP